MTRNNPGNESSDRRRQSLTRPGHLLAVICASTLLSSCGITPPVVGLHPIYPPVKFGRESNWKSSPPRIMFAKVASLQPVLKWKAFPEARDLAADEQGRLKDIGPVRYDLRIWAVTADGSWIMRVYEREGLPQPEHRLEKPLVGMTRYSWTVRASFELNGRTRVTPWSFCSWPAPPASWHSAQRIEETTPASYFSFQTP